MHQTWFGVCITFAENLTYMGTIFRQFVHRQGENTVNLSDVKQFDYNNDAKGTIYHNCLLVGGFPALRLPHRAFPP